MRLSSIWSLPALPVSERFHRTAEWAAITTAKHLPKQVRYWTTMIEIAKATNTSPHIPATALEDVIKNLEK